MNNNICKNGFGAILRSILPTLEYEEKLIIFFEKMREMVHLCDVIRARRMIDVEKL